MLNYNNISIRRTDKTQQYSRCHTANLHGDIFQLAKLPSQEHYYLLLTTRALVKLKGTALAGSVRG